MDFKPSEGAFIGVEMELQLLDSETLDLVDGILPLLKANPGNRSIKPEFSQSTVEVISGVCKDLDQLEKELVSVLIRLNSSCRKLGMMICGGGTHPFCDRLARITPVPRFSELEKRGGYLGHTLMTYALHVHIGMSSGEEAIAVMQSLRPYLPLFLALSASSPFWWGHETGFASYRQRVLASMRSYGLPPDFKNWQDFSCFFKSAGRSGTFQSFEDIHWDIRPRPDMGTLEIRIMDGQPTLRETLALAAFVYTIVEFVRKSHLSSRREGMLVPGPDWIEKENHFRVSLGGLDTEYIADNKGNTRPIRKVIDDVLRSINEISVELGTGGHLVIVGEILGKGPAYIRQRAVFRQTGSLREVVALLAREYEEETAAYVTRQHAWLAQ